MRVLTLNIFILAVQCESESYFCGVTDQSLSGDLYEGTANIENYPWMGQLLYPLGPNRDPLSATVILITDDIAIATALEVDKFPKKDFRQQSWVILGRNCTGPYINVLEYLFHPEFRRNYYSALAILQLEKCSELTMKVPICAPPNVFYDENIYAMSLIHDCTSSVRIYKMQYVSLDECQDFYRRNDLDVQSLWPKHVACAQSIEGGSCLWRSGTALVSFQSGRWHLLGVGVYGPGCEAPARFLDYGNYQAWVQKIFVSKGKLALTRMSRSHIILRRAWARIQRWGPCDEEEEAKEIFSDYTVILPQIAYKNVSAGEAKYNLTLQDDFDYSCIKVRVWYIDDKSRQNDTALIDIVKFCKSNVPMCASAKTTEISFYVHIKFSKETAYILNVFGSISKFIDARAFYYITNRNQ